MARSQHRDSFQNLEYLSIDVLTLDNEVASRCQIYKGIVAEYANAMRQGSEFPPVTVFFNGAEFILVDGFHRIHAKKANGACTILADVWQGGYRDAILYATRANIGSDLKLTDADIRRNINKLIGDPEWSVWYDLDIAWQCGSSDELVFECRVERMKAAFDRAAEANKRRSEQEIQPDTSLGTGKLFDLESALNGDASSFGPLITDQFLDIWSDMVIDKHIRENRSKHQGNLRID